MLNLTEVGFRIKKCRDLQGLTREDFSEKINVSPRFVYDIEQGKKGMSIDTLSSIGRELNISVDYLLFGDTSSCASVGPEIISLIERCPDEKKEYLEEIIKNYILSCDE